LRIVTFTILVASVVLPALVQAVITFPESKLETG
jgi:hypothetical protein